MIERHITFDVNPGQGPQFERFFADQYSPPISESPGFVRVELLREADSDTRYQMVLRWHSADAATSWRTSAAHQALQPELNALCSTLGIAVYDVIG